MSLYCNKRIFELLKNKKFARYFFLIFAHKNSSYKNKAKEI